MSPMRTIKRILACLALLGCAGTAWAVDCKNAVTTPDMNECAAIDQKKADARLNQVYQRVLKSLEPDAGGAETKKKLVEAQRAWIKFRDADCAAVYQQHIDGTIRNMMHHGCMQARTEQRIKELKQFLEP